MIWLGRNAGHVLKSNGLLFKLHQLWESNTFRSRSPLFILFLTLILGLDHVDFTQRGRKLLQVTCRQQHSPSIGINISPIIRTISATKIRCPGFDFTEPRITTGWPCTSRRFRSFAARSIWFPASCCSYKGMLNGERATVTWTSPACRPNR